MNVPCMTVDVESFSDGARELGIWSGPDIAMGEGLSVLQRLSEASPRTARITLFVVGKFAAALRQPLIRLADAGHEIACHGLDHGRLPPDGARLEQWLREGREAVEDAVQRPVRGFRSPRFDIPELGLAAYREIIALAGFSYVSDRHRLGPEQSPIDELPVFSCAGFPLGGGSYQRLAPAGLVAAIVGKSRRPPVLYYHSYDFGGEVPSHRQVRSLAMAKLVIARQRSGAAFERILRSFGSQTCTETLHGV